MNLETLFAALNAAPDLRGALCAKGNRWRLFDPAAQGERPEVVAERHQRAIGLCKHCPALGPCGVWFDSLPKSKRPRGITAARPNPMPPGRPEPRRAIA